MHRCTRRALAGRSGPLVQIRQFLAALEEFDTIHYAMNRTTAAAWSFLQKEFGDWLSRFQRTGDPGSAVCLRLYEWP